MARTFPLIAAPREILLRLKRRNQEWVKHPQVWRMIEDWFPDNVAMLAACRTDYRVQRSLTVDDKNKATPKWTCHQEPLCLPCVRAKHHQRLNKILDEFRVFTPAGKEPRFWHIVFTAPLTVDGEGWGAKARHNITKFAKVVLGTLQALVPGGMIGGYMSYQDFGEQPFTKSHPHWDLTLNGWALGEQGPFRIPTFDLTTSGRARAKEIYQQKAMAFDLNARAGDFHFQRPFESIAAYWKILEYQTRELVDLRKIVYVGDGRIGWRSYEKQNKPSTIDWMNHAHDFPPWLNAYKQRFRGVKLHRPFGFMDRSREDRDFSHLFGGEAHNDLNCPCDECDTWERIADDTWKH